MWTLFLDEFGHEGPFLGKENPKYNQSPIFGFGGLAFESNQVIKFADDFAQMKSKLLSPKYRHKEIKGKDIFESRGLDEEKTESRYREDTANKASRFLSFITRHGGKIFYSGFEKKRLGPADHDSEVVRRSALRSTFKILNKTCVATSCDFMLIFDQHDAHVEKINFIRAIALNSNGGTLRIRDVPYELDSKNYYTIQSADWVCTLLFRVLAYEVSAADWPYLKGYHDRFRERIREIEYPGSALRRLAAAGPPSSPIHSPGS
jgi:hypothetical protein